MEVHIKTNADAQALFMQGKQFLEAAWRCFGKKVDESFSIIDKGVFQQLPAPCVVNAAFSCEMFLKSLLCNLGIKYDRHSEGHDLYLLYKRLPSDIQCTIAQFCGDRNDTTKFEKTLRYHSKDFVDIRYFIERNTWTQMSPTLIIAVAYNLSQAVEHLIKC